MEWRIDFYFNRYFWNCWSNFVCRKYICFTFRTNDTDCRSPLGCLRALWSQTSARYKQVPVGPLTAGRTYSYQFSVKANVTFSLSLFVQRSKQNIHMFLPKGTNPYTMYFSRYFGNVNGTTTGGLSWSFSGTFVQSETARILFQFNAPALSGTTIGKALFWEMALVELTEPVLSTSFITYFCRPIFPVLLLQQFVTNVM